MRQWGVSLLLCFTCVATAIAIEPVGTLGKGRLYEITFLPDGSLLRVLANRIEIADPNDNAPLAKFAGRAERMGEVTVRSDGSQLAIVTPQYDLTQTTVEIWDIPTRRKIREWVAPKVFRAAAVSANLRILAEYADGAIHLWNAENGESVGTIPWIQEQGFVFFALSPDARQLLASHTRLIEDLGGDEIWGLTAEIWDVAARQRINVLDMPDRVLYSSPFQVTEAAFSADARWLVTADTLHRATLWHAQDLQKARSWDAGDEIQQVAFSPDSRRVYVAVGRSGFPRQAHRVKVWDVETGKQLAELGDETLYLSGFSISPDETLAALWYRDGFVALWDIAQERRLALRTDYVTPSWDALTPDGHFLVHLGVSPLIIWDMQALSLRKVIFPHQFFRRTAMSPDGTVFAVDQDPWIEIRSVESGEIVSKIPNSQGSTPFTFSKDGKRLAMGEGRGVVIYPIDHPENPERLHRGAVMLIAFSEDDRYLAASDSKEWIQLWERNADQYVHRHSWQPQLSQIDSLAFAPGRSAPNLLIGGFHRIQVWEIDGDVPQRSWVIEARPPTRFVRLGDERQSSDYLLVNKGDRLQIWDWATRTPIDTEIPQYTAVNRDGSVLLTSDKLTGRAYIWNIRPLLPSPPVAVEPGGRQIVTLGAIKRNVLLQNFPNPFNPETWIPYRLAEAARVRVVIRDLSGRHVRTLDLGERPAGDYLSREKAAYWDGRNDQGEPVSSGAYFYTLEEGGWHATRRLAIMR